MRMSLSGHLCNPLPGDYWLGQGDCNWKCKGDSSQICGGNWRMNVYQTGFEIWITWGSLSGKVTSHKILNISPRFSIVEWTVCQRQEATSVSKIPRQDKHKHAKQLHQTLQGGRQRLLVRRGPVWIRVLLRQCSTSRYPLSMYLCSLNVEVI